MEPKVHEKLIQDTEFLRELFGEFSTESIVVWCSLQMLEWFTGWEKQSPLISPAKQVYFLFGLMLTTPEPEDPRKFDEDEWDIAVEKLNAIFESYTSLYWPEHGKLKDQTEEWKEVREVAMPSFLHYFNTMPTASLEQIVERIRKYLLPFDKELIELINLSATDALRIADWIADNLQETADQMLEAAKEERQVRLRLLDRAEKGKWSMERMRTEANRNYYRNPFMHLTSLIDKQLKIDLESLVRTFGQAKANAYWKNFVSIRGEVEDLQYLTEDNQAEKNHSSSLVKG